MMVHQVIQQRGIQNRGGVELLACDGRADHGEDSGTDDRADAERGKRPGAEGFLQTVLGKFRVADQLVDRFGCEQLLSQRLGSFAMPSSPTAPICVKVPKGRLRVAQDVSPGLGSKT